MVKRKGLGKGLGKGYKNIVMKDPMVHSLSAKGIKQKVDLFPLPIQTAIVIPSTNDVNKPISSNMMKKRVDETRKFLSQSFGGYTSVQGVGGFTTKKGDLVKERVNVVTAFSTYEAFENNKEKFVKYALDKKKEWGQESIGVIIENDLYFVS